MQRGMKDDPAMTTTRPCPLCGSDTPARIFSESNIDKKKIVANQFSYASRKFPDRMHHRLVICSACHLLYADSAFSLDGLTQAYGEAAFDSQEEARCASRTYGGFLPSIMRRLPDLDGALDIGTGDGSFLEELLARGFSTVAGVEPSRAPIAAAKDTIRPLIRNNVFRAEDFHERSLSLVTCFQVLEHVCDPLELFRSIHTLLKPGGAVFSICHDRNALSAKILGMKSPIYDIEHLQLFDKKCAELLLRKSGFFDTKVWPIFNRYPLHYWIKLFPLPIKIKHPLVSMLKKGGIGAIPIACPAGNLALIGYKRERL